MPLYCAGLCDPVNVAPGASRRPAAKYSRSVGIKPRSTTSTPWLVTPSMNASANSAPDGRMSRPTSTRDAPANWANAAPTARGDVGVQLVGNQAAYVVRLENSPQIHAFGRRHREMQRSGLRRWRILISVVLPAFNEEPFLADTVDELVDGLRGRARPFELLIVENGSTDGTGAVADKLTAAVPRSPFAVDARKPTMAPRCVTASSVRAGRSSSTSTSTTSTSPSSTERWNCWPARAA